jgi:SAM-dependent methyltransferase
MPVKEQWPTERGHASDAPRPMDLHYRKIVGFFDEFAGIEDHWLERTWGYHALVRGICRSLVPPGARVLEVGCGRGDLLAALRPRRGVGIDVSPGMIAAARRRHPHLRFECAAGEDFRTDERFDYIVLIDLVPYVYDLQALFASIVSCSHARTRVVVSAHSNAWRPALAVMSALGLRPRRPVSNWVAPRDLVNLAELAGLDVVTERKEVLLPVRRRVASRLVNGMAARLPFVRQLTLTHWVIARPAPRSARDLGVSVVVPCKNEAGSIAEIVERVPEMGRATEIVFVEGGSTDDTRARIEDQLARPRRRPMKLVVQTGKGKWNAVQEGFSAASNEVLMILDGDMTVAPEDLRKFYDALTTGRGDLITGSRLIYGMEPGAMSFLNLLGNKAFAGLMRSVLGQYVKDTLCGTKVLHRDDYKRIQRRVHEFAAEDPFGDFELLLGASLLGMKILNVPVRYQPRVYGETNIDRFSDGAMLARLALAGYRRLWLRPVDRPNDASS